MSYSTVCRFPLFLSWKEKGSELRATCISESWHRISFETCCCTMQVICTWKGRKTHQTRMTRCERLLVSSTTSFSATKTRPSTARWLLAILNITRWSWRGTSRCRIGEISCKLGRCEHISGLWSCVYGNYGEPPWVDSIKDFLASSLCHTQTSWISWFNFSSLNCVGYILTSYTTRYDRRV